jgi:hypothetical protein
MSRTGLVCWYSKIPSTLEYFVLGKVLVLGPPFSRGTRKSTRTRPRFSRGTRKSTRTRPPFSRGTPECTQVLEYVLVSSMEVCDVRWSLWIVKVTSKIMFLPSLDAW